MPMKRAVVLLSGGLDSATTLALCGREGFEPCALSFDYGQRHNIELTAAKRVAASFGVREHRTAQIDLRIFGGSALTDDIPVPKNGEERNTSGVPITYVPARNTIFRQPDDWLSICLIDISLTPRPKRRTSA